jgi:hypothetical protein
MRWPETDLDARFGAGRGAGRTAPAGGRGGGRDAEQALEGFLTGARAAPGRSIIIAERPAEADVDAGVDPRALGLFNGTALPDVSTGGQPRRF